MLHERAIMLGYADLACLRNVKGFRKSDDYWLYSDQINEAKRHHLENRPYILAGQENASTLVDNRGKREPRN
jgi:hypothetical protein